MKRPAGIVKAYDIRGIYPRELNEESIPAIVSAIYAFFKNTLSKKKVSIVFGRDMRISSPSLFEAAKKTLVRLGAKVVDIGLSSTPTFYFATFRGGYDAGIQISASHNPPEYNGIKFVYVKDGKLVKVGKNTGMAEVKALALSASPVEGKGEGEIILKKDALAEEIEFAKDKLGVGGFSGFRIVADPANAMGALVLDELAKRIGLRLVRMNFELDGTFPSHQPDPLQPKNLVDLQKRVVEEKADLGIAPDGDADRVFFIDEKGKVIPATLITALIAREILKKKKGAKIIVDIRYIRNVKRVCEKYGGEVVISPVGHALITDLLNRQGAIFAGESSGHFYYQEIGGGESMVMTILHVLNVLSREKKPISRLVAGFASSVESGEINFVLPEGLSAAGIFEELKTRFSDGQISLLDGIAVDYLSWRFNIRASNTEPLIRLNVEGESRELVEEKVKELQAILIGLGAKKKE